LLVLLALSCVSVNAVWPAGLAWCDWDASNMALFSGNANYKIGWSYTWSVYPNTATNNLHLDFVPMMWGIDQTHINDFNTAYAAGVFNYNANTRTCFLGFNEPDQSGQSNMTPETAVTNWRNYIQKLRTNAATSQLRLGAPAVSNGPTGLPWIQKFVSECTGCNIDFIPIHWYGSTVAAFTQYVTQVHQAFPNYKLWVTEFACAYATCSQSDVAALMGGATDWMTQPAQAAYIERFSWFGAMKSVPGGIPTTDQLLTSDGQSLTSVGTQYAYGGH